MNSDLEIVYDYLANYEVPLNFRQLVGLSKEQLLDAMSKMSDRERRWLLGCASPGPLRRPKGTRVRNISVHVASTPKKPYHNLLREHVKTDEWNESELMIRNEFLEEVEATRSVGGCSGCRMGALRRKYIARLEALEEG